MVKPMKIVVTDKTDFEMYDALNLGDVLHFDGFGIYTHPNGEPGTYDQWWLDAMLKSGAFVDVTEDDPLPPVPDAIDYREARLPQLYFRAETRCDDLGLTLSMGGAMVLDADSILQLAHDLRRMAMQIKRNQKQEQAQ